MPQEPQNFIESIPGYVNGWIVAFTGVLGAIFWVFRLHGRVEGIESTLKAMRDELHYMRDRIDKHFDEDRG